MRDALEYMNTLEAAYTTRLAGTDAIVVDAMCPTTQLANNIEEILQSRIWDFKPIRPGDVNPIPGRLPNATLPMPIRMGGPDSENASERAAGQAAATPTFGSLEIPTPPTTPPRRIQPDTLSPPTLVRETRRRETPQNIEQLRHTLRMTTHDAEADLPAASCTHDPSMQDDGRYQPSAEYNSFYSWHQAAQTEFDLDENEDPPSGDGRGSDTSETTSPPVTEMQEEQTQETTPSGNALVNMIRCEVTTTAAMAKGDKLPISCR